MAVVSTGEIVLPFQVQTGLGVVWTNTSNLNAVDGAGSGITLGPSETSRRLALQVPATPIQGEPVGIIVRSKFLVVGFGERTVLYEGPASTDENSNIIEADSDALIGTSSTVPTGALGLTGDLIRAGTGMMYATVVPSGDTIAGSATLDAVTIEIFYNAANRRASCLRKILRTFGDRIENLVSTFSRNILIPGINYSRRVFEPLRRLAVAIDV